MSREHFVGGILTLQHPVAQKTRNLQDLIKSCSALTTDALVIPSFPRVISIWFNTQSLVAPISHDILILCIPIL